jgi:hypothetical protein
VEESHLHRTNSIGILLYIGQQLNTARTLRVPFNQLVLLVMKLTGHDFALSRFQNTYGRLLVQAFDLLYFSLQDVCD